MNPAVLPSLQPPIPRVRFKNILFATDLSEASAQAQSYAARLAHMFGAHLFVLHVDADPAPSFRDWDASPALINTAGTTAGVTIDEVKEFFRASGVPFTLLVGHGKIQKVLNRVADEYSIDLIILGSHGRQGIAYLLLGSMAEKVGRSSRHPVITVGPACAGFGNSFKTILYATDFSDESTLALPFATSLAQEFHANLTIFHAVPNTDRLMRDQARVGAYLLNRLKSLVPQTRFPWCTLSHAVAFGNTTDKILEVAKERKADLIILGLHGSVRFISHVPERLSYRVLCDAPCPVLSVLPSVRDLKLARLPAAFRLMAPQMS